MPAPLRGAQDRAGPGCSMCLSMLGSQFCEYERWAVSATSMLSLSASLFRRF